MSLGLSLTGKLWELLELPLPVRGENDGLVLVVALVHGKAIALALEDEVLEVLGI